MRILNRFAIGLIVLSGFLTACSTLGIPQADTFNKKWAEAQQTDTAVLQGALTLAQNGKITPDQLRTVEKQTDNAKAALDLARQVHSSDATDGNNRLAQILTVLNALQAALASPDPGGSLQSLPPLPTPPTN